MLSLKHPADNPPVETIKMCEMEPLQIARIVEVGTRKGHLVMRTAALDDDQMEIMDLTCPGPDECWDYTVDIDVQLLQPGERVLIELFN